ncbi:MAG TPA: DUF3048 C-terminal domain-containing protein [Ilumatobacteraceae bacterium]|nr:DUF3048 C-terminal domain-containing protein [Ilumatobacteraceae bacterium]
MPLTGLPVTNPLVALRAALVIKVSNDPQARPQTGINQADIIFEAWGAGPTRFATVWHSQDAAEVGPIRSGRTQDVALVGSLNGPLFACSGGNARVVAALRNSDLLLLPEGTGPGWHTAHGRHRPHATYNDTQSLWSNAQFGHPTPVQQFAYRDVDAEAAGEPMSGVDVKIQTVKVSWRWDPAAGLYLRDQDGRPHMLSDGTQVSTENVVIMWTDYQPSPADARSPEATSLSRGEAIFFTGGKMIEGTWERLNREQPFLFHDAAGEPVLLQPGRTFIEMTNSGRGDFRAGSAADIVTPIP